MGRIETTLSSAYMAPFPDCGFPGVRFELHLDPNGFVFSTSEKPFHFGSDFVCTEPSKKQSFFSTSDNPKSCPDCRCIGFLENRLAIPLRGQFHDYQRLTQVLRDAREQYPDHASILLLVDDRIKHDLLIHTMDVLISEHLPNVSLWDNVTKARYR